MQLIKAAVVGASGYAGGELLRILSAHPHVEVLLATAHEQAGRPVASVHPNLRGIYQQNFSRLPISAADWPDLDVIFVSLPHGKSMAVARDLPRHVKVVDLGGDFRLRDEAVFSKWYHMPHVAMDLQPLYVYGQPEAFAAKIKNASRVATPGCFATAAFLALKPLVAAGLVEPRVIVDAKTGSSGSGVKPSPGTHHPSRAESFSAYKPYSHQHLPEIRQALSDVNPEWQGQIILQTHSAPMVRGIFASVYARLLQPIEAEALRGLYLESYAGSASVRIVDELPNTSWVRGSNFCDIGLAVSGQELTVFAVIDNIIKGAAGQAVQNMNLMFGLPESTGLQFAGGCP